VLSKQNILFNGKKEGFCCPIWASAQLPEVCHFIIVDVFNLVDATAAAII